MAQLPPVTPEIAKAVWDSLPKPSRRQVADRLNASGKYRPTSDSAVGRWKKAGWQQAPNADQFRNKSPEEKLNTAAVIASGNPVATLQNVIDDNPDEFAALRAHPELQDEAHRIGWAGYILAHKLALKKLRADPETTAIAVGNLEKLMARALRDLAAAQKTAIETQPITSLPTGDNAKVIEHSELDAALDAYRKHILP